MEREKTSGRREKTYNCREIENSVGSSSCPINRECQPRRWSENDRLSIPRHTGTGLTRQIFPFRETHFSSPSAQRDISCFFGQEYLVSVTNRLLSASSLKTFRVDCTKYTLFRVILSSEIFPSITSFPKRKKIASKLGNLLARLFNSF